MATGVSDPVHRRALPIADPCHAFRPQPGRTFCGKCEKHVHDLSAMTSREAARFLAAHAGQQICVAYRTAADGTILVRPEARALGVVLVALALAACTGYAPDVQHPDENCRDPQGYEIDCRNPGLAEVAMVPELETPEVSTHFEPEPEPKPEPEHVPETDTFDDDIMMGAVMVDESFEARVPDARQARREARRERRAARGR